MGANLTEAVADIAKAKDVATKGDIKELRAELRAEIAKLETETVK